MNVLSNDTKKIIDDARDTLVGQIPVPMMQCQQITLALTYKFMSDDDQRAERLGGERHYFAGDLEPYGWDKIMSLRLDDTQRSELYRAGIGTLQESDSMPAVFREIFKDAVVPFGDHRTLALFLSTMDRMVYDDSEKLGDAYEYLLKTAEAQADAGQFRTPRHIIDFIVKIINPQKHEVIIDPACGTAGFLVSAYQHVKSQHDLQGGGSSLSVPDFTRLADNLKGYDISPEMTKLAMANMYLHTQDKNPNIDNYDTLTSADHWNEYADVMLANPPFMTPKGGIRPHTRFRVSATKAEVLFVDYIASHLNEHGRAGIIVPQGIIFQSQNAYRQLRRFLLDESLVAVISLPAGVFKPYSGVKTSILILDKVVAPTTDHVAFFNVANDGFDLGDQRRPINQDDLPAVSDEINEYLRLLRTGASFDGFEPLMGQLVAKHRIGEDGDYNLSGERYRLDSPRVFHFPIARLGEVAEIIAGQSPPGSSYNVSGDGTPFYQGKTEFGDIFIGEPTKWTTEPKRIAETDDILMSVRAPVGPVNLSTERVCIGRGLAAIRPVPSSVLARYAFYVLRGLESEITGNAGATFASINKSDIAEIEIPLPPLEVQRELVAEIEGYQRVMDGARAVIDNWQPRFTVDPEWPTVELGDICEGIVTGPFGSTLHQSDYVDDGIPVINPQNIIDGTISTDHVKMVSEATRDRLMKFTVQEDDIVIGRRGEMGRCGVVTTEMNGWLCGTGSFVIRLKDDRLVSFVFFQMSSPKVKQYLEDQAVGVTMKNLNQSILSSTKIPLPSLETQQAIVAEIEAEQALVSANRELVERMEQRIQDAIGRVWEG